MTTPFKYPQIYNFPPFFTKQPHAQTYATQRQQWIELILNYARHHRVWVINDRGRVLSQGDVDDHQDSEEMEIADRERDRDEDDEKGLFVNTKIDRVLDAEMINDIFEEMINTGVASYVQSPSKSRSKSESKSKSRSIYLYWNTPEDWASMLLTWVEGTGQLGSVLTLYEIQQGDMSIGQEFHGIHSMVLQEAVKELVKIERAQVLKDELGRIAGVKIQ